MIDAMTKRVFQATVWDHYHNYGRRDLAWRHARSGVFDPYNILVSELMLQQTQVARVASKYDKFLQRFPTIEALAQAPLGDVLQAWSGLGYNRRAKFLQQAAQRVTTNFGGTLPNTAKELITLSGVGIHTAGAIMAYAFDQPAVFVETNIRTVIIHHFFNDQSNIPDKDILALTEATLDHEYPREWYWALMDYGSFLKQSVGNLSRQSKAYTRQSKFEGSKRQVRGQVLRLLGEASQSEAKLATQITDNRLSTVLRELLSEGLIQKKASKLRL